MRWIFIFKLGTYAIFDDFSNFFSALAIILLQKKNEKESLFSKKSR